MLSYQHIYHAGNLADVQKHALLAWTLDYLTLKDKPLSYLETHAGRGLYHLDAAEALKTGEAAQGITRVEAQGWFAADHPYTRLLTRTCTAHGPNAYPGSPLIAAQSLRPGDRAWLAELHPREFAALQSALAPFGLAEALHEDGLAMALSRTPPTPRRGLILIDPSFEVKSDYERLPGLIADIHRKWNVGVLTLWYPILTDERHRPMLRALEKLSLPEAIRHEVRFPPARTGHGMVGSGLFAVNAPWGFAEEAKRISALCGA